MWLPGDHVVELDGKRIDLTPTLKAAMRLHRGWNGLDKLLAAIGEGSLKAFRDILSEGAHRDVSPTLSVSELDRIRPALVAFVNTLAGGDLPPKEGPKGKSITVEDWHVSLFKIGTGWLGWTPRETLGSTISQIIGAHEGRIEQLEAVFGSGKDTGPAPEPEELNAKVDAFLNMRGGRHFVRNETGAFVEIFQ